MSQAPVSPHSHPHSHPARLQLPADTVRAAKEATSGTKTDFRSLLASSLQESHLDTTAKNKHSSATGAYQFTERTWLDLMRRHGAELGQADAAAEVTVKDGKPFVAGAEARENILALRSDASLAGGMAARYFEENRTSLGHSLGRKPSDNEVRMAYFLGAHGATRLIKAAHNHPDISADKIVASAVKHNPSLFHNRDGSVATAREAVASLNRHFDATMAKVKGALGRELSLDASATPVDDDAA
jgi:hypothetical protein